jgi:hypothetical protein
MPNKACTVVDAVPFVLRRSMGKNSMFAEFNADYSVPDVRTDREREAAGWRGVASAWVLVGLIVLAFAGLDAAALLNSPQTPSMDPLAGAVIPRHDPVCAAPLIPSDQVPERCFAPINPADQRDFLLTPGT